MYPFFIFSRFIQQRYIKMLINPKTAIDKGWIKGVTPGQIQPNAIDFTIDKAFEIQPTVFMLYKDSKKQHRKSVELPLLEHPGLGLGVDNLMFGIPGKTSIDCMSEMFVELPAGVAAKLIIRSTLNRNGLFLTSGLYDSGFKGNIGCVLHNMSEGMAFIEKGSCIGQIEFYTSDSNELYKGGYNTKEGEHWKQ